MTTEELDQKRREHWHTAGAPLQTLDDARAFVDEMGVCLFTPVRAPLLLPAFLPAWSGGDASAAKTNALAHASRTEEPGNELAAVAADDAAASQDATGESLAAAQDAEDAAPQPDVARPATSNEDVASHLSTPAERAREA